MKLIFGAMAGAGLAILIPTALAQQADDPLVGALRDEMLKTIPAISQAKTGIEGVVGHSVGPTTVLIALFIVFCGRGFMTILDKALTHWIDERKATRDARIAAALAAAAPKPATGVA